ncbi:MAG: aminoacyl-tRNA hydrolase [Lachnospirales bacterium]
MYLIIGLGNPEKYYKNTRHNIGFETINKISYDYNIAVTAKKHKALIGKGVINKEPVILAKPQTYMNLSGESVKNIIDYYNIPPENLIVIYDDITLDVGIIKVKKLGSAGGHNGVKNIIEHLKTSEFARVKIGIGSKPSHMVLKDYVLTKFLPEEHEEMVRGITLASEASTLFLKYNIDIVMNKFNTRR